MALSKFLKKNINNMKQLVNMFSKEYNYVSLLGMDNKVNNYITNKTTKSISESRDTCCGFVLKLNKGKSFLEYSFDDIKNPERIYEEVNNNFANLAVFNDLMINTNELDNEYLEKDFLRKSDFNQFSDDEIINYLDNIKQEVLEDSHILNCNVNMGTQNISKVFVSKTKCLTQNYTWVNGNIFIFYKGDNERVITARSGAYSNKIADVFEEMPSLIKPLLEKADNLTRAKQIEPGIYDIITHPSISGLIAHEAFGHGVEMDQFTKHRALAEKYVNDYVASPLVNMKDGAGSAFSVASYFFDDDGILAHDTDIIKDGILVSGISDMVSASILGKEPTGNGRRESYLRKAYTRMTNTFFLPGNDKLEDMIKSVKHGYMLFETNNGMEDPKNWGIQCACEYGIEIVDGKLTNNYVAPVVLSGYVPDLLKSITMVSKDLEVIGSGGCGKGYKEWVRVSDGGPYLKGRVKLS